MKYPCPKCLMALRNNSSEPNLIHRINRDLSVVCNAAPYAPPDDASCCCGAGWIPCMPPEEGLE